MLALAPLAATAGTATSIDGAPALVVEESFAGTPCVNGELWPTAIAGSDAEFAAQSGAALAVLESVNFTP